MFCAATSWRWSLSFSVSSSYFGIQMQELSFWPNLQSGLLVFIFPVSEQHNFVSNFLVWSDWIKRLHCMPCGWPTKSDSTTSCSHGVGALFTGCRVVSVHLIATTANQSINCCLHLECIVNEPLTNEPDTFFSTVVYPFVMLFIIRLRMTWNGFKLKFCKNVWGWLFSLKLVQSVQK